MLLEVFFGIEFNFGLMAGNDSGRFYEYCGAGNEDRLLGSAGETRNLSSLSLVDTRDGFKIVLSWIPQANIWRYPVETVSLSESGIERLYQCSSVIPFWRLSIPPKGQWVLKLFAAFEGKKTNQYYLTNARGLSD
jgi:alpha-amylase